MRAFILDSDEEEPAPLKPRVNSAHRYALCVTSCAYFARCASAASSVALPALLEDVTWNQVINTHLKVLQRNEVSDTLFCEHRRKRQAISVIDLSSPDSEAVKASTLEQSGRSNTAQDVPAAPSTAPPHDLLVCEGTDPGDPWMREEAVLRAHEVCSGLVTLGCVQRQC